MRHHRIAPIPIMRRLAAMAFLLMSMVGLANAQSAAIDQGPVRIGVIGPFTGPSSDFGIPMLRGIELAVEEMNAVGGYLGRKLELVVQDDKADPDQGRKAAQDLVRQKVMAVLGFCNTGVAMNAIDLFQDNKIPLIVPCAAGTAVTSRYPAKDSYVFRVQGKDSLQAPFMVDEMLRRGWNRVAVFSDTTGYGDGGLKDITAALAIKKLQPVYVARFPLGVTDLTKELAAARDAGANVVYTHTVGTENAVVANGKKALGWKVTQTGPWTLSFPNFIDGARDAAEGALMVQTFIAEPSNERRAAFLSGYSRKFAGQRMAVPMAAANAYDATYLLMYSFFGIRNGRLTGPDIKESLEGKLKTYYGVVSTYDRPFSLTDKDAVTSNMLVIGVVRNGAITFAHADDAKRNLFVQRKRAAP